MITASDLLAPIRELQQEVRRAVVDACERASLDELSGIAAEEEGDTIYAIDRVSEETLVEFFSREVAPRAALVLIAEGIEGGRVVLPRGTREEDARWRIIVDPIDGTRAIMYQKRSAWVLTGVAPNRGPDTRLSDIALAVQTEIPLVKQHLCDVLWALAGEGAHAERVNRLTGRTAAVDHPAFGAQTIAHGFAMVARFFPGAREELAAIDEEIVFAALGPPQPGKAHLFEDQYISLGRAAVRADGGARSIHRRHPPADGRAPVEERQASRDLLPPVRPRHRADRARARCRGYGSTWAAAGCAARGGAGRVLGGLRQRRHPGAGRTASAARAEAAGPAVTPCPPGLKPRLHTESGAELHRLRLSGGLNPPLHTESGAGLQAC